MPLPAQAKSLAACCGALCAPRPPTLVPALVLGLFGALPLIYMASLHKEASLAPLTACRRAVAVDVESTARSSAPAAETSGKEHRLQPALAARRFAQKAAALTTLYALNKALAVAVADAGIHAPSALIGKLCHAQNL